MTTGEHSPVVVPGDVENSILAQKVMGTQAIGVSMPPSGLLPAEVIDVIASWIEAGASDN